MAGVNVGPADARGRRIAGTLAVVGGIFALDALYEPFGLLTWIVCAIMVYVAFVLIIGGFKEGTGTFGLLLLLLAVADGFLPLRHLGYLGLIAGVIVAAWMFTTARSRHDPVNQMFGVNTAEGH